MVFTLDLADIFAFSIVHAVDLSYSELRAKLSIEKEGFLLILLKLKKTRIPAKFSTEIG